MTTKSPSRVADEDVLGESGIIIPGQSISLRLQSEVICKRQAEDREEVRRATAALRNTKHPPTSDPAKES
ncbi:MAG: hypothetical protein AAF253_12995 [Pseudomonadota bacterium]